MKINFTLVVVLFTFGIYRLDAQSVTYDTLDANNVRARINCNGTLFEGGIGSGSLYQVPKSGNISSINKLSLWLGGLDDAGQMHLAALTGNNGDYQPGPVSNDYSGTYYSDWNRVWKVSRSQIQYHMDHWFQVGYLPIPVIASWPGNGDTLNGQTPRIAPFMDLDNDGIYNPYAGDYPLVPGDQALFFIFNDDVDPSAGLNALNLKVEFRGLAYSFNCPEDSALMYTTFYHYDILNRSGYSYHDCAIGVFADADLGYAWDDYVGSEVSRSSFYAYNGKNFDGVPLSPGYGSYPPVQAFTILGGPFLDSDGIDNPAYDSITMNNCGYAVNGTNFGDDIADNERLGLTGFYTFYNTSSGAMHNPLEAADYFHYLNGQWLDGLHFSYADAGHYVAGPSKPDCNFIFPYDSDPCNWGTDGIQPPGYSTGAGGSGPFWTMPEGGLFPDDVRGIGVSGPFTLNQNVIQSLDLALVFGRNFNDTNAFAGLSVARQRIDQVRNYFSTGMTPCGSWLEIAEKLKPKENPGYSIYPNPSNNIVTIDCQRLGKDLNFSIVDLIGVEILNGTLSGNGKNNINVTTWPAGVYFIRINNHLARKLIINR